MHKRIGGLDLTLNPYQLHLGLQKLIGEIKPGCKGAPVCTQTFQIREKKRVRSAKFSWQNVKLVQALQNAKTKHKTIPNFKTRFLLQQLAEARIRVSSVIKKFYFAQGCRYLQVEKYGLFYVGPGVCPYGIPSFEPKFTALRLQFFSWKKITLALVTQNKSISRSLFSLDPKDKLTFPVDLFTRTKKLPK